MTKDEQIKMLKEQRAVLRASNEKFRTEFIDEACDWLCQNFRDIANPDFYSNRSHPTELQSMYHWSVGGMVADFRKAMKIEGISGNKEEIPSNLTWQDMLTIVSIYGYTNRLDNNGKLRSQEDIFTEILTKFKTTKQCE